VLTVLNVAYPLAPVGPDAVGGAEQVLTTLDTALVQRGHRSLVLACHGSSSLGRLFTIPRLPCPLTSALRRNLAQRYRAVIDQIVEREAVDVVHLHGLDFHGYLPRMAVPVLATLHLPPSWYPAEVFRPERPHTYMNCVSESQRQGCPASAALLPNVPNGVDLSRLSPEPPRDDYVLLLGRVCPEKGMHLALDAAHAAGLSLLIAGEVFPYPDHIRYFASEVEPRLDAWRRFIGAVGRTGKARLLARARCLVVPSLVPETSSLVTMEALASGTPVVALPSGALPDLIDHGRTGFLVKDVPAMAQAMLDASALPGTPCRQVAEARFSSRAMCDGYLGLYAELAAHTSPRRPAAATIDELRAPEAIAALTDEWSELWQRSSHATVFQRPEWLLPWCAHLLGGQPCVVTIRRSDRLVALAPFFEWMDGPRRVLSLMGGGVSDYLDVVVGDDFRAQAPLILERWLAERRGWDRCEWSELRTDSLLLTMPTPSGFRSEVQAQDVCTGVPLADYAQVGDAVSARWWANVVYSRRHAAREGLAIDEPGATSLDALFDRLEQLHQARWQERGQPGVLHAPSTRLFHRQAAGRLLPRRALLLRGLRLGGDLVAVLYGFHDRDATRCYLTAFDTRRARHSPGALLVADALEDAHRRGAKLVDFLRGAEPYKYRWGACDLTQLHRRILAAK
jgi:CelD/BcsL family acetyltransferase involved in cellulose biosynthesis/glycosyltransferase involved in cell wall biosynthesis